METVVAPCRVPWMISPSMSGLTLNHGETDSSPECSVVFGGCRLTIDNILDNRRVEISFEGCYYARTGPKSDSLDVEALGYRVTIGDEDDWRRTKATWRLEGLCPRSGFYVAQSSAWLSTLPDFYRQGYQHYVIVGRDAYVELIAKSFTWSEWLWLQGHREDVLNSSAVVARGEGIR